jgi:hypothetical protein
MSADGGLVMHRRSLGVTLLACAASVALFVPACGSGDGSNFPDGGRSGSGSGGSNSSSGTCGSITGCGNSSGGSGGDGGVVCPAGLQCNVQCGSGTTTSISGVVLDPAGKDPLYDIAVYVPAAPLQPLPKGVPTGADMCSCPALFKSGAVVSAATGVDGSFSLKNAPVGTFPLVAQVGKWRKEIMVTTTACQNTAIPSGMLALPGTLVGAGPNDNMPDIAVSTGSADTLECLMERIGIPASEYVLGNSATGHVHLFSGGGNGNGGSPEQPGWNAPASPTSLWDTTAHLMPYDILLLSCEGGETFDAIPANLESYLNAGGRAFASHYHYSWFSGPNLPGGSNQSYTAPPDWGPALAQWTAGSNSNLLSNGKIIQTLNGSAQPFAKGQALFEWLGLVNALGPGTGSPTTPAMELPISPSRFNAVVGVGNKPSQSWVQDDMSPNTMYFSFDTPVNAPPAAGGGAPNYCGRAVFADMHVSGNSPDPAGDGMSMTPSCTPRALSPQEKALEFMLFDLSACVIPDTQPPSDAGVPIVQ